MHSIPYLLPFFVTLSTIQARGFYLDEPAHLALRKFEDDELDLLARDFFGSDDDEAFLFPRDLCIIQTGSQFPTTKKHLVSAMSP